MDLKTFIKTTLIQIGEAITESESELKNHDILVSPRFYQSDKYLPMYNPGNFQPSITMIDFDVAITVQEEKGKKGKAELSIASVFSVGGELGKENISSTISRVKFQIPVLLKENLKPEKDKK